MTVCSLCWEKTGHVMEARLVYPPHVMQFLRQHGQQVTRIPPHNPACPVYKQEGILEILYPQEDSRIWIPRGIEGSLQRVIAQAVHRDRDCRVFWYVDGMYAGESKNKHDKALLLVNGTHTLEVVDEYGNRSVRHFQTAARK
jgi:penicillin-binding protein 1C